eukprot:CAMPEP_0174255684 /NCGR_PEP_ID=MMETSP0439-20130205/4998_1 /TAXON_ID=0 /ORGANISM="Stereomyxa ramosa, Strain Chinc5" /LENGTH=201 /DNA_ID=CAMNT_0015337973 /DNA_START=105 /DNA_END=707 /DNA_ORIENTATION=-
MERVTTVGRRKMEEYWTDEDNKLEQVVLDMDDLTAELRRKVFHSKEIYEEYDEPQDEPLFDVAFCCLGTTRKQAGSAAAFRKVDFEYVNEFAEVCKEEGVKFFQLVTSQGANSKSWFLYMRTKGEIEEAIKDKGFEKTVILRPGLLLRGADARTNESIFSYFVKGMPVGDVALAMKELAALYGARGVGNNSVEVLYNADIW